MAFRLESKAVRNEWWWSFGFLSMVGNQNVREEEEGNDGVAVGSIYLPFHLLFFAGSFSFFYWHRPSRVNRIESVKETDAFSTERQREAEGKGVVTHLSWPSPLWATFPPPPSGPDVWKWNCFNFLTARTKSSRVSEEGKISLWKRQEKMEPNFILFHYRRYDVSVCVCPWVCKILRLSFSFLRPASVCATVSYRI